VTATWRPAGHILGSATLEAAVKTKAGVHRVVFSGDLGRYDGELMNHPETVTAAKTLLVESTYGNRLHSEGSIEDSLVELFRFIVEGRGVLLVPSFAVGRTQQVLYYVRKLQDQGRIADLPVYVDSPMAVNVSHVYCWFGDDHNLEVNLLMDDHTCPLRCRDTHFVQDVEESKALNTMPGPAVILSASGMCTGGRILHHLKWRLPHARNAVLFVGYQAQGTRGRRLRDGAKRVRIHGEDVPVRARIASVDALSAHADRDELLRWLKGFDPPPQRTFIIHGEPEASEALAEAVREWGWQVTVPQLGATYPLS